MDSLVTRQGSFLTIGHDKRKLSGWDLYTFFETFLPIDAAQINVSIKSEDYVEGMGPIEGGMAHKNVPLTEVIDAILTHFNLDLVYENPLKVSNVKLRAAKKPAK